ncbi:MAG: hypothetical protein GY862_35350, partial [Gammaproteobacteria bacterium]|nr:hypothetical protein [Gammaproteobacteria bacterium]
MALPYSILQALQSQPPKQAWETIFAYAWDICSPGFGDDKPESQVIRRDRATGDLDLFLATAAWDLWRAYESAVPRTSVMLSQWWKERGDGKAVLILDALSLREIPWILHGAAKRGFTVHNARAAGAELPSDTTSFAKSLGFAQRSALANNQAGSHKLAGARTETTDIAWKDCADLIDAEPDWVFWHRWPD